MRLGNKLCLIGQTGITDLSLIITFMKIKITWVMGRGTLGRSPIIIP